MEGKEHLVGETKEKAKQEEPRNICDTFTFFFQL